jgi:hypothetical protein
MGLASTTVHENPLAGGLFQHIPLTAPCPALPPRPVASSPGQLLEGPQLP